MLYFETVYPETLELLKKIQNLKSLSQFSLAGGTALSLYYGHRISIDLDLFTNVHFKTEDVILEINECFAKEDISIINVDENSIFLSINEVKIDILAHRYSLLKELKFQENEIELYAKEDIIAMKLNALANRGTKKDFFDIYEVLQEFTLVEILGFFEAKYVNNDKYYILRSLTYFEDAEKDINPIMIKDYNWAEVKSYISSVVTKYIL